MLFFRQIPTIAFVTCGDRLQEALNMVKSVLITSRNQNQMIRFAIVTEKQLMDGYREKLGDWKREHNLNFIYEIHSLKFPEANKHEWKKLFKPCAAQRLFLPVRKS